MSTGEVINEEDPGRRLLWSDSAPDDLTTQEVKELQEHGFLLKNWDNPDENTVGTRVLRFKDIDSSTYLVIRRTPIRKRTSEDDSDMGLHFGLITSIENEVAERWEPETVALSGLIEEFKRRRQP
jgi:hypothetical protein